MTSGSSERDMAEIVRRHYDSVFRFCARRVGADRAADVAQETFLTAQKAIKNYRGESNLATWLLGIANNECRRMYRKMKLEPLQIDADTPQESTATAETAIVDRQALRHAMAKLSLEHREVVVLHELEGLTYDEAALILAVPVGTVKSRLHHAFAQMRRSLFLTEEVAK